MSPNYKLVIAGLKVMHVVKFENLTFIFDISCLLTTRGKFSVYTRLVGLQLVKMFPKIFVYSYTCHNTNWEFRIALLCLDNRP